MRLRWTLTARWAGNLQDLPLTGTVRDYKQIEPGLIEVAILCEHVEVSPQVAWLIGDRCSGITIAPCFERRVTSTPEYRAMDKAQMLIEDADRYTEDP